MTVHIIHGIYSSEDEQSTPMFVIPDLIAANHDFKVHEYGYAYALTTRWENPKRALKIARHIKTGDIIIAHSNGCDITRIMLDQGIMPEGIILLQPALDVDTVFAEGKYWINVFHNEEDKAVLMAKWFLWFHHPYGAMGRYGYKGNDQRVVNYDTLALYSVGGHSDLYVRSPGLRHRVVTSIDESRANPLS